MKESKDRTEQFMHSAASAANTAPTSTSSSSHLTQRRRLNDPRLDSLLFGGGRQRQPEVMADGSLVPPRSPAKGKGRSTPNGDILAMDIMSAEEGTAADGGGGGAFMQMQLVEQQVRLLTQYDCSIDMKLPLL
jgi:syntaxin 5